MTHETKDARALVERLRSIQPNWIDTAIGAEAAGALTAALDRAEKAEAINILMQREFDHVCSRAEKAEAWSKELRYALDFYSDLSVDGSAVGDTARRAIRKGDST